MAADESLADRMRRLAGDGDDPDEEEAVRRARAEKASLAERIRQQQGVPDDVEGGDAEPGGADATDDGSAKILAQAAPTQETDAPGTTFGFAARLRALDKDLGGEQTDDAEPAPHTRRRRLADWFMGRFEQSHSDEAVTPIPPMPEGWDEVEFKEVEPPYSYVRIRRHRRSGQLFYEAIEPPLNEDEERVLNFIQDALVRGLNVDPENMDRMDRAEILQRAVRQIITDYRIRITDIGQERVLYYIERDFIGLGPIQTLMVDPGIEDISCDGAREGLFVFHREHESVTSNIMFESDVDLDAFVIRLAQRSGKSISISDPILDAALPDGSRLQATLGREVTENGSTFTIRRFKPDPFTPVDLVRFGSMSKELLAYFWFIVENGSSLIFSGGTASGKTTGLNAISQFIPPQAKIVSIEDTREVNLPHKNWIKAVTRTGSSSEGTGEIGMFELLKASLRQRPEYILVGEVRGIEASVAFQAMATGHTVYSTMHADSARSVVYRLENEPINVPRLVLQALDVIAIQGQVRYKGKRVRRLQEVVELVGMDPSTRELLTHTVFTWDNSDDTFHYAGRSYLLEDIADARNWSKEEADKEMTDRIRIIEWMMATGRTSMADVTRIIHDHYQDRDRVVAEMDADLEAGEDGPRPGEEKEEEAHDGR